MLNLLVPFPRSSTAYDTPVPIGTAFGFWVNLLVLTQPAGSMERFFNELYALTSEDYNDQQRITSLFEQNEMKILGPPLEGKAIGFKAPARRSLRDPFW